MNHPMDYGVTARCLDLCGSVGQECSRAILDPEREGGLEQIDGPEKMAEAAKEIRLFLTTEINPKLATLKERMARYAEAINNMIDHGKSIPDEMQSLYNETGMNGLREILNLFLAKTSEPGGNIFYRGLLRMLYHRLNNSASVIVNAAFLDLDEASHGKFDRGRFPDHYVRLQTFDLTEKELTLQPWDIYQLADRSADLFQAQLLITSKGRIKLNREWGLRKRTPMIFINTHETIFGECAMELMRNAERAIQEDGGEITTSIGRVDGCVVFSVTDTGSGIDPDVMPKIFDDGFTTRPEKGGTGKGLNLVRTYVESIGGRIEVESSLGKGSTFSIWLPAANYEADQTAIAAPSGIHEEVKL